MATWRLAFAPPNESPKPAAKARKLKWKEERELEGMEAAILAAEAEVVRLEGLLNSPEPLPSAADYADVSAALEARGRNGDPALSAMGGTRRDCGRDQVEGESRPQCHPERTQRSRWRPLSSHHGIPRLRSG